jgi:hypothetical protein
LAFFQHTCAPFFQASALKTFLSSVCLAFRKLARNFQFYSTDPLNFYFVRENEELLNKKT